MDNLVRNKLKLITMVDILDVIRNIMDMAIAIWERG